MATASRSPKCIPSRFRTPFRVQRCVMVANDSGGQDATWVDEAWKVWGDVKYGGGSEQINAQRVQSRCTVNITARWDKRLDAAHRLITIEGHIFNVRDIHNIEERGAYMLVTCEEGVAT